MVLEIRAFGESEDALHGTVHILLSTLMLPLPHEGSIVGIVTCLQPSFSVWRSTGQRDQLRLLIFVMAV